MSDDLMNGVDPLDPIEVDELDEEGNVVPKNIVDLDEEPIDEEEGYAMFSSDDLMDEGGLQFE